MNSLIIIPLAIFVTMIGALPFGLVNLSVLDISYRKGQSAAMSLSLGATFIEVVYGLTALVAGGLIGQFIKDHQFARILVLSVPAVAGLYFLLKGKHSEERKTTDRPCFLRGMLLNLVSVQVLLYWLFAMTYLVAIWEIDHTLVTIILFAVGIWLGKMGVLWLYAAFSNEIYKRMGFLSRNINRIIGVVLIATVVIQILK